MNLDNGSQIIQKFFDLCVQYKDNGVSIDDITDRLLEMGRWGNICRSYHKISVIIFDMKQDDLSKLKAFCGVGHESDELAEILSSDKDIGKLGSEFKDNLNHFHKHILLSIHQRSYIDKNMEEVEKKANEIRESVKTTEEKVSGIYSEFIGILGVFTALSFALMGSVQVLGNLFDKLQTPNLRSIGYILVSSGAYLILIYLVIMTLFIGMKKIFATGVTNSNYRFNKGFTAAIIIISIMLIGSGLSFVICGSI